MSAGARKALISGEERGAEQLGKRDIDPIRDRDVAAQLPGALDQLADLARELRLDDGGLTREADRLERAGRSPASELDGAGFSTREASRPTTRSSTGSWSRPSGRRS